MSDLTKVEVIIEYWYEGRHYSKGECLSLPIEMLQELGMYHFKIIKDLKNPPKDKMVRLSTQK